MALETAAAIIGILAAAGKVAEILGPVVSAFRDVTKHAAAVLSEVNSSRIILSALQMYLDDLGSSPKDRKDLIQVDQLVCTMTDGVLIFSDLEKLAVDLAFTRITGLSRLRWLLSDAKFATLISRMQCFKSSITVMLNILQCESDREAFQCHQELLSLIAALKKSNQDLSKRLTHFESGIDTSTVASARRAGSVATTMLPLADDIGVIKDDESHDFSAVVQFIRHPFEKVLFSSRVYHKAKRKTSNESLRSSVGLSQAWTALSDVSLSKISCISVVALPIYPKDLSNRQHYSFASSRQRTISFNTYDTFSNALAKLAKGPQSIAAQVIDALRCDAEAFIAHGIIVKGSQKSNPHAFVEKFTQHAEPSTHPDILSTYYGTGFGEDITVRLRIDITGDGPVPLDKTRAMMDRHQSAYGRLFVLLYDASSRTSLDRIVSYYHEVLHGKPDIGPCTLVVCLTRERPRERQLIGEGLRFAQSFGARFDTLQEDDVKGISTAFNDFVSSNWIMCVRDTESGCQYESSPPATPDNDIDKHNSSPPSIRDNTSDKPLDQEQIKPDSDPMLSLGMPPDPPSPSPPPSNLPSPTVSWNGADILGVKEDIASRYNEKWV